MAQQSLVARVETALRQQDSRRSRHDGADGRRAGRSGRSDAAADADDRHRDHAHGRARAEAADRERHRTTRSGRSTSTRSIAPTFRRRPIDVEGAVRTALAAAHRPADRAQQLRNQQRAAQVAAQLVAARRRRRVTYGAAGLGGTQWTPSAERVSTASRNGILFDGGYTTRSRRSSAATIRTGSSRSTSAIRSAATRPSAGGAHAIADSAEPGADSRHRADGRDRSHQRRAAGDQQHRRRWPPRAPRASCRSGGSTPR